MTSKTTQASNFKTVDSFKRIATLYVDVDGKDIEVKEISNPELYTDKTVYQAICKKGATKGQYKFCVASSDYISNRGKGKIAIADKIASLQAQGLTPEQIIASLL